MTINDLFHETSSALLSNKVRSGLTVLGIVIGIASVIAMLSIGNGAKGSIQSSIESIGSNLVMVQPGFQRGVGNQVSAGRGSSQTLKTGDADAIKTQISSAKAVAPDLTSRQQVIAAGKNTNTSIVGTVSEYTTVRNIQMAEGSFLTDQHQKSLAKVAVLGPTTRDDLFGEGTDAIGKTVRIKGINFTVIGITAAKGGSGFNNTDDRVYIPLSSAQKFINGGDYVSSISIQAESADSMQQLQADITSLLLERHNIADPAQADFSTLNQADILNTASSVTNTFTILLASVAGISLVVGGIGIMNMMLTTVTERTREIGLRKAIGAKGKDIRTQFLVESILLTLVGGMLGVLLGCAIAFMMTKSGLMQATISLSSILLSFGVSALIGIVFGYYPARRASNLNPIEALRYE
jgi:putative ABC transport system permease protein